MTLAIRTVGLCRSFGALRAVEALDLEVPTGQVTAFLGPNGAGKTTTIRLLLGLLRPDAGRVELFGRPPTDRSVFSRVGALIEMPSLYSHLSGRQNLDLTRSLLGLPADRVESVLELVDLQDAANRRVGEYSLGMRQRLGLALALLQDPELLILDEPTNGLDPVGIREIRSLLRQLVEERGVTIFLSSHLLAEVEQVADRLVVLRGGRRVFAGTPEALRAARGGSLLLGVDQADEAQRLLEAAGRGVVPAPGGRLRVEARDEEAAAEICGALVASGIGVHHLALENSSLETAFLELTEEESS